MLSSLAPARRRVVLAALTAAVVAAVGAVAAIVVVVAADGDHDDESGTAAVGQDRLGPVVLVPGYGGSTTGLDVLARTLRERGRDVSVFPLPGDGRGDLDAQAVALGRTVSTVRARHDGAAVDVVGYSAGGVVARLWVADHGGDRAARRVLTLGSPHHGTDIAALAGSTLPGACPVACRQLAPDSTLLADLNAGDETPAGPTFVSVWTTHDDVVVPASSARLAGAVNLTVQSVCPGDAVRHAGLPSDPRVGSIVLSELAAGPPARAATVAC
ncbi:Triacylglycerol esterase/lipase EstA, alpha/beta hydrolase fold [Jatrophihabitans endophyticus]|uniref:Triacylglycerol esterase/lipase EstA, alpha/beta hydrolase fold n=1 Tax=Jatrophihabitans endophyticus TaxID=1206085 RepID=A0A1M5T438_9ACTN|nr:alpha/beta fold hydrolase [Jatrophihabitans endophyticus]SHH45494.1 Triacylglycerol esterase/lipase EstA, alpha/beta hydrolase fold [Jatrophihabitans endophyticus]